MTPREWREKHARNTKAARDDMIKGIDKVREAPGQAAAEKSEKMLAGITAAVTSGKWADRVAAVPLEEWKRLMKDKGVARVSAGIDAAAGDIEAFASQLGDYQDSYLPQIQNMPDLTIDDSEARMVANMRNMSKFQRR
jgi:hypothetical protein